jgi:hypothetical protein
MSVGTTGQNDKTIVVPVHVVVFGDTPDQPPEIGRFVAGKTLPF